MQVCNISFILFITRYIIVGKYARDLLSGVESELDFNFLNKPTAPVKRRKLNQQSAKKAPEYIVLDDD